MKAVVALFKNLANGTLFIKAENLSNYYVFIKGDLGARIYGSGKHKLFSFEKNDRVIVVVETTFPNLPVNHQFAYLSDAQAACGILVPKELRVKVGSGYAADLGANACAMGNFGVADNMRIIDLAHIFNVRMVPVATLNFD